MREAIKVWLRRISNMKKSCPEIYWSHIFKGFIRGAIVGEDEITYCLCPITALVYQDTKKCPNVMEASHIVWQLAKDPIEKIAGQGIIHAADNQCYHYSYNGEDLNAEELKQVRQHLENILINGKEYND